MADLHAADRHRSGVPLAEVRVKLAPSVPQQAGTGGGPFVHHRDCLPVVQVIRRRLAGEGMNMSWATVRSILAGQQRVTVSFRRKDGRYLHMRKATQAEGPQREIYRALGIDEAPGGVRKTVV